MKPEDKAIPFVLPSERQSAKHSREQAEVAAVALALWKLTGNSKPGGASTSKPSGSRGYLMRGFSKSV